MSNLNQHQLAALVKNFYAKVDQDPLLGPIFNEVAKVNWDDHIPKIAQFWNSVMLGARGYKGNPMLKHLELNKKVKLKPEHFEHWLRLFTQEAESALPKESAALITQRAHMIADNIQKRLG